MSQTSFMALTSAWPCPVRWQSCFNEMEVKRKCHLEQYPVNMSLMWRALKVCHMTNKDIVRKASWPWPWPCSQNKINITTLDNSNKTKVISFTEYIVKTTAINYCSELEAHSKAWMRQTSPKSGQLCVLFSLERQYWMKALFNIQDML